MKPRVLDLIICPIDKTRLELLEWESAPVTLSIEETKRAERLGLDPALFSKEILTGALVNRDKRIFYPIYGGIPRMLTFPTEVTRKFTEIHAERIAHELPGFTIPREKGMPGEVTVLRTFSSEWVNYDWDGQSYWNLKPHEMNKSLRFLLDLTRRPVKDTLVVEVGIGIGGFADFMARSEECELVGIDLSHAVDLAYRHFGSNAFLHIVQSSVFALPVRDNSFSLVYSHGVLHHTFSTKSAFDKISKLPEIGGRLYAWVYSPYDERRTFVRRAVMLMEALIRPICWRLPESLQTLMLLPIVPLYLFHQNLYAKPGSAGSIKYGLREAMHAARDRFTPRYVHRHSEEEVLKWFSEAGYVELQCVSGRKRPNFVPISFVTATGVDGVRR